MSTWPTDERVELFHDSLMKILGCPKGKERNSWCNHIDPCPDPWDCQMGAGVASKRPADSADPTGEEKP